MKTEPQDNDHHQDDEVKNPAAVLAKNKELLAKMKTMQAELDAAQAALTKAKEDATAWRGKWHQAAVIAPFDAALESASAGPSRYLRAELLERGILKMEADADGIERPVFYHEGKPNQPDDVWKFLRDLEDPQIDRMIRGSGASGSGATGSSSYSQSAPDEPKPTPAPATPALGLR